MDETRPSPGQRVRVTIPEAVVHPSADESWLHLELDGGHRTAVHLAGGVAVEVLPDPEPPWWPPRPGDVVQIGQYATHLRTSDGTRWVCRSVDVSISDDDVLRTHRANHDVTLLVRAGKPYEAEEGEKTDPSRTIGCTGGPGCPFPDHEMHVTGRADDTSVSRETSGNASFPCRTCGSVSHNTPAHGGPVR